MASTAAATCLDFPPVTDPEVSVLVVTYGAGDVVRRALEALARNTPPVYELIVVDNASPDGLGQQLLGEIRGARVVLNPANRGFGMACNQAAGFAVGRVLVFLNSDAFVHPGWLPPLLEALERERTGAAASKILNVDGTLQEAGCLVFANAHTRFMGLGDDPARWEYLFPRRVDYASAVCLAVKRRVFHDAGGFDPAFGIGYCEDVDLCLRIGEAGLYTVYEPRSVVTHVRGASSDPSRAVELWSRNHPILFERWKARLASRPASPGDAPEPAWRQLSARDAPASLRVLIVEDGGTEPACQRASRERTIWIVRSLARRWPGVHTTLWAESEADDQVELSTLLSLGVEVVVGRPEFSSWLESRKFHDDVVLLRFPASGKTVEAVRRHQPQAQIVLDASDPGSADPSAIQRSLESFRAADLILASDRRMSQLARDLAPALPTVVVPTRSDTALDVALLAAGVPPESP